ncbi:MAG: hypothetical protein AAF990_09745 [Bacteroidota bacterium]
MSTKSIAIRILESTPDFVRVLTPFLRTPIEMNYEFLNKRLENGYFQIAQNDL